MAGPSNRSRPPTDCAIFAKEVRQKLTILISIHTNNLPSWFGTGDNSDGGWSASWYIATTMVPSHQKCHWCIIQRMHVNYVTIVTHDSERMTASPHWFIPGHGDVIKWKHYPHYWPLVRGVRRLSVISPHKGQWRGALMFSWICIWINGWINNREADDLRRYRAHYYVTVMCFFLPSHYMDQWWLAN